MGNPNESNIDNLFRNELGNASVQPPAQVWANVSNQLGTHSTVAQTAVVKSTVSSVKILSWIAASIVSIAAGVVVYNNLGETNIPQKTKETTLANPSQNISDKPQSTSPKTEKAEGIKFAKPAPPLPDFSRSVFFRTLPNDNVESKGQLGKALSDEYVKVNTENQGINNQIKDNETSPIFANSAKNNSIKCRGYYEKTITQPAGNAVEIGISGLKGEYTVDFGNGKSMKNAGEMLTFKCEYYVRSAQYFNVKIGAKIEGYCNDSQIVKVFVRPNEDESQTLIPTVFTPNGDGKNDSFFVRIVRPEKFELTVLDQIGAIVFQANDLSLKWDGTFKGIKCREGVYTAIIRSRYSGETKENIQRFKVNLMYNNND
jgi:gliding motility-associated-like protein